MNKLFAIVNPFPNVPADDIAVTKIMNLVFIVAGATAIIILIIGGIRYIVSQGEPQNVAKAKNTIIYAFVGLLVILSATLIVNFILNRV